MKNNIQLNYSVCFNGKPVVVVNNETKEISVIHENYIKLSYYDSLMINDKIFNLVDKQGFTFSKK